MTGNGGTFAPGDGTAASSMTVTGNLTLTSTAQYLVQVDPATASFANITGTATLGGATVSVTYANGSYVARQYTILSAAGGVVGTFGTQVNTNLPANFTSSLVTDATHAYLNLTLRYLPPTPDSGFNALTVNQQQVANTLVNYFNRTGGIPLAFGALTATGLTQVSGQTATGAQQTAFDATTQFMGLMTDPLAAGRDASGVSSFADPTRDRTAKHNPSDALAAIDRKAPIAPAFEARWNVWAAGFGGQQSTDGNVATGSNTGTSRI
ncbi:hypothetical protein ONR75_10900 [Rhodopseudomonas sp. P2A-2r]|uniref:hypothetical protein n=1 Tax=Rhodopseudomonas sp. P2A-2r TaxID=2991972 RepID=UPI0022340BA1|nr:hypothetical protein [Rhodopseudomonas sp. P2A-2r]UZE51073.1 hypothetical protein ONR75_10900 [Rhodopseudomonas sp. P2A-2r]